MADKIPDYNDFDLSSFDELPDFPESVQKPSYKKKNYGRSSSKPKNKDYRPNGRRQNNPVEVKDQKQQSNDHKPADENDQTLLNKDTSAKTPGHQDKEEPKAKPKPENGPQVEEETAEPWTENDRGDIQKSKYIEKPDREREGFHNVLKEFADTMSEITGEPVRQGDVVGVMYSAMNAAEVPNDQRLDEYRKSLYLYHSERRAYVFFTKTRNFLDKLISVVAEEESDPEDLFFS